MTTKLFSIQLWQSESDKDVRKNEAKLNDLEKKVNVFIEKNSEFKQSEWLQSSAASQWGGFTTVTVILRTC